MTNEAGVKVWSATHDPFGRASVVNCFSRTCERVYLNVRFPGQYYDGETGLHYNYFRYYDPATGRYITSDPIGLAGGLNTFLYVGGNPLNRVDSTGLIDPVTVGIIWATLYATEAGDAISDKNGNVWGKFSPQDGTCTLGLLSGIGNSCFPKRCQKHDDCYTDNQCNSSSWVSSALGGTKSCNSCNSSFLE